VRALAAAFAALAFLGGAHDRTSSLIVFSADRAPAISGDVFRADRNGHVVNLTHSPWQDSQPLVSPNGKLVAFLSDRGGSGGLWVIGVDGTGLRRVPAIGFPSEQYVQMAWSPDSRTIALTAGTVAHVTLSLATPGGRPRTLVRSGAFGSVSWSPDGSLVAVHTEGAIGAYTPAGKLVWSVPSGGGSASWSAQGLFATGAYDGRVHVVDESGRERFSVAADSATWSADGTRLTAVTPRRTRVFTSGGRLVSSRPTSRVSTPLGLNTAGVGTHWTVRDGSHVYAHVYGCGDDGGPVAAIQSLQPVPGTRSVVYASYCAEPFDNLYSINSNGTGLRRITNVQANQVQPRLSPDLTRIAFAESQYTGLSCKGCPQSLRTIGVDGRNATTLTSPPDCTFDDSPAWSPDGTQIMFSHSACDTAPGAEAVASVGGTPTSLHIPAWTLAWGPTRIAYANGSTAPTSLWSAAPNGDGRVRIASVGAGLTTPAWSPDGRLAYLLGTSVVVNGKKVALPFAQVRSLAWSPDGTRFLVAAKPKGAPTFDLYTVKTDGTDVQRLTLNLDVSSADWR